MLAIISYANGLKPDSIIHSRIEKKKISLTELLPTLNNFGSVDSLDASEQITKITILIFSRFLSGISEYIVLFAQGNLMCKKKNNCICSQENFILFSGNSNAPICKRKKY